MLHGFLILIGCQLAGEILAGTTGLPIPGPVLGMLLLFSFLLIKRGTSDGLAQAGNNLLKYIGLLFVPAGAGISVYLGLIAEYWDVILIASVTSTILTLIICAALYQILNKSTDHDNS
ncbi:MAG: CidA/LrgA family protein [Alphaproteobacteria bacterium PRO2]|nr:CidA/LrgA family protein [Alphaproteobacteria bacterium PRO2]